MPDVMQHTHIQLEVFPVSCTYCLTRCNRVLEMLTVAYVVRKFSALLDSVVSLLYLEERSTGIEPGESPLYLNTLFLYELLHHVHLHRVFQGVTYWSLVCILCFLHGLQFLYRVIKKSLCTWWLQYRKLQVLFKLSPISLQTFINTRLTLSIIPYSNYIIVASDWNNLAYFCVFFVL
jgi:hypothetical protein